MTIFKWIFSVCQSFRTACCSGGMKGIGKCAEVEFRRRQNLHALPVATVDRIKLFQPGLGREKSLWGSNQPRLGKEKALRVSKQPRLGKEKSLWGSNQPRLGKEKFLWGSNQPLLGIFKPTKGLHRPFEFVENVNSTRKFSAKKCEVCRTRAKAVAFLYPQSCAGASKLNLNIHPRVDFEKSLNAIPSVHEDALRRKVFKQAKSRRDREPSRLPAKRIINLMRKRKATCRCKLKHILRKSTQKSSRLYSLLTRFKLWYITYLHRCNCFFSKFLNVKKLTIQKMSQNTNEVNSSCSVNNKKVKTASCTKRYCVSRMKLLQSGDIELNPGPDQNGHDKNTDTRFYYIVKLSITSAGIETFRCWR